MTHLSNLVNFQRPRGRSRRLLLFSMVELLLAPLTIYLSGLLLAFCLSLPLPSFVYFWDSFTFSVV